MHLTSRKLWIVIALPGTVVLLMIAGFAKIMSNLMIDGPSFSKESGFYEEPFELTMQKFPGFRIYYTLDGTEPTSDSTEYVGPILIDDATPNENIYSDIKGISGTWDDYSPDYPVDKATVVKAIAVDFRGHASKVSKGTYFVGYGDKPGYDDVKIMSMVVDPDDLFSDDRGIYVIGTGAGEPEDDVEYTPGTYPANYNIKSEEMRRPARVTLWDEDRLLLADEDIAIAIHGGWSRGHRQKPFNFYQEDELGPDRYGLDQYMLRTSGYNDTLQTMFRDVLNQSLVKDRGIAVQDSSPCILFINGEYWGLYNLQQRYSGTYFRDNYHIEKDNLICIKQGELDYGLETDVDYYNELIEFSQSHDLSDAAEYDRISQMMDIQSFIDYYCFECYIANMDWPGNNECCFRSRRSSSSSKYEDGRWRWAAYDTDDSCNANMSYKEKTRPASDPYSAEAHHSSSPLDMPLMKALMANEGFRAQFADTMTEMADTCFAPDVVDARITELADIYRTPVTMTQNRFNDMEYTEVKFDEHVSNVREFYRTRAEYVLKYTKEAVGPGKSPSVR